MGGVEMEIGLLIDVETTGFGRSDEIVEYGHILFSYRKSSGELVEVLDEYSSLREPSVPIGKFSSRVNGIYLADTIGKSIDRGRIVRAAGLAQKIYAHNARFDKRFVGALFPELLELPWYCSMQGVDWEAQGVRDRKLECIARHYGMESGPAHRALADARTTLHALQQVDAVSGLRLLANLASGTVAPSANRITRERAVALPTARISDHEQTVFCNPLPEVIFTGKSFCFTGVFACGDRRWCEASSAEMGGTISPSVTKKLSYLVVGSAETSSWAAGTLGGKIAKAVEWRSKGADVRIISESHWVDALNRCRGNK